MRDAVLGNRRSSLYALIAAVALAVGTIMVLGLFIPADSTRAADAVSFGKSLLQGESTDRATSLQFGPDGRLYVSNQGGTIKVYTIARNGANNYSVTNTQTINLVRDIPNHDDNGTLNTTVTKRQVTGLVVGGTASNPVLYVSSADPRMGGGADGGVGDSELDTNSGTISRLSWNGSSWNKVDLVRGLTRSERTHTVNGLQLDETTNTLYVAVGGNTNTGAPSINFALMPEYALSAAVLSIDLDAIGNTTYDVPTLNDENRSGNPDANDPFGGNDGKNQARIVPGGPVQVYASGFRNPYDVLIAQSGKVYTIDNGSNQGWGDIPVNEGPAGNCTNDPNEPGISTKDTLHRISAGYYGGHPNPTRGNTNNKFNSSNPQSPVPSANPVECDYRAPGTKGELASFDDSTNGLTEYTASNFGGAMTGDLLAAGYNNDNIRRIKLNAAGDAVVSNQILFSDVGTRALDVTAQGDNDIFPGTIWVADIGSGNIVAFEPDGSGGSCTGADNSNLDEDGDGFDNADEIDNGTNPCSAADAPPDNDGDKTSDLNDPNDDNDSLSDTTDPFAVDEDNGKTTNLPVSYSWDNEDEGAVNPGGLMNLGFTGLMTNKSSNYATLFDSSNMTAGGAAGVVTVDKVPAGTASKANNTQKYGLQFGVNATSSTGTFTAHTRIAAPFAGMTPENGQSMGLFVGNGDQDNYVKLVTHANDGDGGLQFSKEVSGSVSGNKKVTEAMPGPEGVDLYLTVDPAANTVESSYRIISSGGVAGPRKDAGAPFTVPSGWFGGTTGFAVGIISTSSGPGPEFPATWEFIEVLPEGGGGGDTTPPVATTPKQSLVAGSVVSSSGVPVKIDWSATDDASGIARYELQQSVNGAPFTDVALSSATATSITLNLAKGDTNSFQVRAQDGAGNWSDWEQGPTFKANVLQESDSSIVYTGTWLTKSLGAALAGGLAYTSTANHTATLTLDGLSNIAWIGVKDDNRGKAGMLVDGVQVTTIDLYSTTQQTKEITYARNDLNPSQPHTLQVKVLGTKNASSSGTRVDVDAFVVLSSP